MAAEPLSISDLILSRLIPAFDHGLAEEQLGRDLFPFVAHQLSEMQWQTRLRELLEALARGGLVGSAIKGAALTWAGQRRACDFLGIDDIPPLATWDALFRVHIVPRAIGLQGRNEPTAADGLRVAILRQRYSLPLAEGASLREAHDALAWREIGFDRAEAFTAHAVLTAILSRVLGIPCSAEPEASARLLAAHAVGAAGTDVRELRIAAVRRVIVLDHRPQIDEHGDDSG